MTRFLPKTVTMSAAAALILAAFTSARAEPFVPASDAVVLARLPAAASAELRRLAAARAELRADPDNLELALDVALAYARLGRREADPRYEGYAQAVLAPWWDLAEPPVPVLLLRASLKQRQHAFDAAMVDIDAVLRASPDHPQAWLTRAMILAVQGEPRAALAACERLVGAAPVLLAEGCAAHAGGLGGRVQASYHRLGQAVGLDPEGSPELRVWAETILAELAVAQGAAGIAATHFERALGQGLRDPYLLAAYADFLLDRNQPAEVIALLQAERGVDPLLLRLAIAERRLGSPAADDDLALLRARFEAAQRRGDRVHLREHARFTLELLDQPRGALRLALANWANQREPADARIVLEAALAADHPEAAAPVLAWLTATGLEDVRLRTLAQALDRVPS